MAQARCVVDDDEWLPTDIGRRREVGRRRTSTDGRDFLTFLGRDRRHHLPPSLYHSPSLHFSPALHHSVYGPTRRDSSLAHTTGNTPTWRAPRHVLNWPLHNPHHCISTRLPSHLIHGSLIGLADRSTLRPHGHILPTITTSPRPRRDAPPRRLHALPRLLLQVGLLHCLPSHPCRPLHTPARAHLGRATSLHPHREAAPSERRLGPGRHQLHALLPRILPHPVPAHPQQRARV